jgi:hypothetical protein
MDESDGALEAARRLGRALAAMLANSQAIAAAELAARGIHPVSVAHGEITGPEDAELICGSLPQLAAECGSLAGHQAGSEHTTFFFTGPGADAAASAFIARILVIAPEWWRVTPTAHPVWR